MTIHAFQETYLNKAQSLLGEAFDYAINCAKVSGEDFIGLFLSSPISKKLAVGDPSILLGKSGIEVALLILGEDRPAREPIITHSEAYWIGWALAFCQWSSDRSYAEILGAVTYEDLQRMYLPYHESDVTKFAEAIEERVKKAHPETNLKRLRGYAHLSQAELAGESGVSLRSIQMYEQRRKDINKASAETLYRLAKAIGCTIEDLLEK